MLISNDLKYEKINQRVIHLVSVFISVLTMMALAALVTPQVAIYSTKAQMSEALLNFPLARERIMSDYSYSGQWPNERTLQNYRNDGSNYIGRITFDGNGTINFLFSDKAFELSRKTLSFVASRSSENMSNKIIWNCGFSEPVAGFKSIGKNKTTVEKKYLPESCR